MTARREFLGAAAIAALEYTLTRNLKRGNAVTSPFDALRQAFWQWVQSELNAASLSPTPPPPGGYTFAEEFNGPAGSAPDPSKWVYDIGGGGWGNGELEVYTNTRANSYLDGNSNLVIAATNTNGVYNSARLKTLGKFSQMGGSFEAKIKLNSQPGIWPAFWMMGVNGNWPQCGEVDVLEDFGHSAIQTTVHTPNGAGTFSKFANLASDTDWHIYRLDWNVSAQTFAVYRDNINYLTVNASQLPPSSWVYGPGGAENGGMYFLLNVAVGGFVGTPNPSSWPVTMLVDYVHAWI